MLGLPEDEWPVIASESAAIGLAMQTFVDNPAQWRKLASNPQLGGQAVEEVIRVNPTVTWVTRQALEDFTFEGLDIAAPIAFTSAP
jgi:cytochrome P450